MACTGRTDTDTNKSTHIHSWAGLSPSPRYVSQFSSFTTSLWYYHQGILFNLQEFCIYVVLNNNVTQFKDMLCSRMFATTRNAVNMLHSSEFQPHISPDSKISPCSFVIFSGLYKAPAGLLYLLASWINKDTVKKILSNVSVSVKCSPRDFEIWLGQQWALVRGNLIW